MSLKDKAKEVMRIIDQRGYQNLAGEWVDIGDALDRSLSGTKLYRPHDFEALANENADVSSEAVTISCSNETTQQAAARMCAEGASDVVLLNFASARNPGGGFINGAKAQEEDLSRCSTLYASLITQMEYYKVNRAQSSMLYTDHIIYSPSVPWFRTRSRDNPDQLYIASVITAPAPNARQVIAHGEAEGGIEVCMLRRSERVLAVARDNGHQHVLLGAWGCGVFGNDPFMVARCFKQHLSGSYKHAFKQVHFAVYSRSKQRGTYDAFAEVFAAS